MLQLDLLSLLKLHTWLAAAACRALGLTAATGTAKRRISADDGNTGTDPPEYAESALLSTTLMGWSSGVAGLGLREDSRSGSGKVLGVSSTNLDGVGDERRPVNPEKQENMCTMQRTGCTQPYTHPHSIHTLVYQGIHIEHITDGGGHSFSVYFENKVYFSMTHLPCTQIHDTHKIRHLLRKDTKQPIRRPWEKRQHADSAAPQSL